MFLCHLTLTICYFYFYVFVKLVMFPNLVEVPYVGDVLCIPAAHFPLVSGTICSRGAPYVGCVGRSVVLHSIVGGLAGPSLVGCQALLCASL